VIHDLAPEERRAEAVSYFSLALYGGLAAGPVLGEVVLDAGGFDAVWALAAVGSAGAAALALLVPDTRPASEGPPAAGRIVHPAAFLPGAVLTTSVWGFSAFSAFIPLYALQVGMDGSRFVFLTYAVVVLLVRSIGARIPDAYGPRRTVGTALIGSMIGLTVMAAWDRPAGLFVGAFVLGLGHSLTFPGLMTIAVRGAPASERGAVVGTFTAFFDLSFGIGAVTLGAVAEVLGYRGAFLAAAGVALAGAVLLLRLRNAQTSRHRA
jgi:predicted MFS family arabinose efflux permease